MYTFFCIFFNVTRESNLKFFTIQAHKEKELDKYPLWLEVIRRFIRSSEFETPFGLKLLAFTLNEIIDNKEMSSMNLELSKDVDKQEVTKPGDESTEGQEEQGCDDSEKDEKGSNASNSTVLYPLDAENNKADECNKEKSEDSLQNSDSSSPDSESSSMEEKSAEDIELDQLLRLVSTNPSASKYRRTDEGEKNEEETSPEPEQQEENISGKIPKSKEPELSLLDCFSSQDNEEPNEVVTTEMKRDDDFVKQFNNEVKNLFLFSSESCPSDVSESEKEEMQKDEEHKENSDVKTKEDVKKVKVGRKRRKDDLRKYRISTSEDDDDEGQEKSSKKKKKGEKKKVQNGEVSDVLSDSSEKTKEVSDAGEKTKEVLDDEDCDIISDSENSVEVLAQQSHSDTEVVQVGEFPPERVTVKGRKNINKILDVRNLQLETKRALKMEAERKKRLKERQELIKQLQKDTSQGSKLILDFDPDTMEELVVVDEYLSKYLKPYQREGVRFMWDCCFESLKRVEVDEGSGCVLAHCMGLGKTLQVITVIHTALTHSPHLRTVLIVCPLITLRNWFHEFKIWMSGCNNRIEPYGIGTAKKRRLSQMQRWVEVGGVLIVTYDMFRTLIKNEKYSKYCDYLLNPGPDIVVCDEGHLMKNPNCELSKCVSRIRTLRRIVLTGTPLQNNLIEYYCMVQFVKPNILGTKKEFMNRFVNPITNGQFENSTQNDVFIMKQRSHVLHTLLKSFVQRLGYDVLEPLLPEKQEFVISVALTETQGHMYSMCTRKPLKEGRGLLWDFHWFHKIWTHPLVMKRYFDQNNVEEDLRGPWEKFIPKHEYESIKSSNKLVLLFSILRKCREIGDKVLVFSQSLYTLGLIEYFLLVLNSDYVEGRQSEFVDSWVLGQDYFKLTGLTKSEDREIYFEKFRTEQRGRLFLISTRAGGLGINLVAANRVILFDASWNPIHDLQSIFRVYRFGQKKPCYIYRFLAAATMEEKIYRRQITKLSLAHRILDEHQIERHYTSHNLQELYTYNPLPKSEWKIPKIPKDEIFAEILSNNRDIIVCYHEHNSLLENKEAEELTEEERRAAWENYEKEKTSPQKAPPDLSFLPPLERQSHEVVSKFKSKFVEDVGYRKGIENQQQVTLVGLNEESNGYLGSKNLLELGDSFGLKPYSGEKMEVYRKRVECALNTIFPWGTPKIIIQGDVINEE